MARVQAGHRRRNGTTVALVLAAYAFISTAVANDVAGRIKDELDRAERERRDLRLDDVRPGGSMPLPELAPDTPPGGPCFTVGRIQVIDAALLGEARVRRAVAPLEGACLTAADIAVLKRTLTEIAFEQGLVTTRVVVPEQNLSAGELRLQVWPGRLEAVQVEGLPERTLMMAMPLAPGDLLNLRALDQTVENLDRLASMSARVDLLPGETPGGSIAAWSATRTRPLQLAVSIDGQSLNDDPDNSARAALTWDNLTGLADRLVLGVNAGVEDLALENASGWNAFYDVPFGWWRLGAGAERYAYDNDMSSALNSWRSHGNNGAVRAEVGRVLFRDATRRLEATLHGRERTARNYIDDVQILVSSSSLTVAGLRVEHSRRGTAMTLDAALNVEHGKAESPAWPGSDDYARADAFLRLAHALPVGDASLQVEGQWADDHLLPSEQFSVAGAGRVPGFAALDVVADQGAAARLEYGWTYSTSGEAPLSWRPALRLDTGWASGRDLQDLPARISAVSALAGMRRGALAAQLQAARPLPGPSTVAAPEWQLDASLTMAW